MSWSRRRTIAILLAAVPAALNGCGIRPLYGKRSERPTATEAMAQTKLLLVRATRPKYDHLGQVLHNNLLDRINPSGRPSAPRYALAVNISVSREETGLQITEQATRARLTVNATFTLSEISGGKPLLAGTERSINSYNIVDSQFATQSAEHNAEERAVREIADAIKIRLAVYFDGRKT